jgi:hypothetical protein
MAAGLSHLASEVVPRCWLVRGVRLLERALPVQVELDPHAATIRCDLLPALGEGLLPSGEALRVKDEVATGDRSRLE